MKIVELRVKRVKMRGSLESVNVVATWDGLAGRAMRLTAGIGQKFM